MADTPSHSTHPWPSLSALSASSSETLAQDMARRWESGERPLAEEYLARYPHLADDPDTALDLIYEEVCLRRQYGEAAAAEAVLARYPQWREQLRLLLDCHRLLEGTVEGPRFPAVGETLGEYRLVADLGRGGVGRVYLATQPALADRPVVLKLAPRGGREHLSLARLQHTHIVPLYAAHEDAGRDLHVLCMPFFGSVTLGRLLDLLRRSPPRDGRGLLEALDRAQESAVPLPPRAPAREFLARLSYQRAVCWVGACLAEALHYAHERGLVHLDIKPSNVLLAADGTPMLLDFHLARAPLAAGPAAPEWLGGTAGYMPPEQRAALAAVRARGRVPAAVDGRADLFALGVLLYELLGGQRPAQPETAPPLWRCRPGVGVGLSDVVQKCLAASPADRYPDGAALARDLRAVVHDLPLRGVRNRSLRERWARWRRRRPHALGAAAVALLVLAGALAAAWQGRQRLGEAERLLGAGQEHLGCGEYAPAAAELRQGLGLAAGVPFGAGVRGELRHALDEAERRQAVADLHELADRVRFLYLSDGLSEPGRAALRTRCLQFWERRGLVRDRLGADARVRADLLDLAVVGAGLSNGERAAAVLSAAEAELGPSPVLDEERRARGLPVRPDAPAPATAWEHCAVGRCLLRAGDLAEAARHLDEAVRQEPGGLWPNFYRGQCAYRQERYEEAVVAFSVCVGAAPLQPVPYVNRGLAHAALKRDEAALADYAHALRLDPTLAGAAVNRAALHLRAGRRREAEADLRQALRHDPANAAARRLLADLGAGPQ
jgi:serine/threonine protein kinase/Flp pilus assembly protein TadD